MRIVGVLFVTLLLASPGLAAGQAAPPGAGVPVAPPPCLQGPEGAGPGSVAPWGPGQPPGPHRMTGPGGWWKEPEVVKALQLTEAQVAKLEESHQAHRLRMVALRAELERQEILLQPLLEADRPDESQVAAGLDRIAAARGALEKERVLSLVTIRRLLSVEQWKQLQAFHRGPGAAGRPGGAGGPGGRMAPPPGR